MFLKILVALEATQPAVTRVLAIDPGMTLDRVHAVLQAAFSWQGYHLHQFTQRNCTMRDRRYFAYPHYGRDLLDAAEYGEPEEQVGIGKLLREEGDFIEYEYDFGDSWVHRLTLAGFVEPAAQPYLLEGTEEAPAEDSRGSQVFRDRPAQALSDARLAELNAAIAAVQNLNVSADCAVTFAKKVGPFFESTWRRGIGTFDPLLDDAWRQVYEQEPIPLTPTIAAEMALLLEPWKDFLRRAEEHIPLTQAGYLTPAFVTEFGQRWDIEFFGTGRRETDSPVTRNFHELTKKTGLTRKYRNTLRLSKAGAKVLGDDSALITAILRGTLTGAEDDFEADAIMLGLIAVATGNASYECEPWGRSQFTLERIVAHNLGAMGWRIGGHAPSYAQAFVASSALSAVLDPLMHREQVSAVTACYCAWQGLRA